MLVRQQRPAAVPHKVPGRGLRRVLMRQRQGTCCTFTCQPRSPDKRVLFCRALLLLHALAALPECVHEVELVVITASCADHVAMSGSARPAASTRRRGLTPIAVAPAQQRAATRAPAKAEATRMTAAPRNPLVSCDRL